MVEGYTKEFLSQIVNLKNSYFLSIATVDLISHKDVLTILEKDSFVTEGYKFDFKQISDLVSSATQKSNKDFEILVWEYLMFVSRALLINLYEAFKGDDSRYALIKEKDWFVFLANIRHACAHGVDCIWDIKDYGNGEISYTRSKDKIKIIINKSWNGKPMKFEQIGGWSTIIDILVFIEREVENLTR